MATKQEPTQDLTDGRKADILPAQLLPTAVPPDRNKEERAGYDCEFVESPPSGLQTECPICLLVLKEPCIIDCCGHKFCRECIERIEDENPCPLCNESGFTFLRERALERALKDLEVWCSYKKEGCEWKEKLRKLEQHLNRDPSPENRLNGCQFTEVECTHECGRGSSVAISLLNHETQQCKKRPYSCDYCRDYHSTFEDVTEVHYPQCGKYPVACPNDCDVYMIERQHAERHLREQYLKWPFRGKITIQIVNQVGDHDHVEKVIPYNDQTPDDSAGRSSDWPTKIEEWVGLFPIPFS